MIATINLSRLTTPAQILADSPVHVRRVAPGVWEARGGYTITRKVAHDGYVTYQIACLNVDSAEVATFNEVRGVIAAHQVSGGRTWHVSMAYAN